MGIPLEVLYPHINHLTVKEVSPWDIKIMAENQLFVKNLCKTHTCWPSALILAKASTVPVLVLTKSKILTKKFDFVNSREGFHKFESNIRSLCQRSACKQVLIGMEPSSLYWYGLYERLKNWGSAYAWQIALLLKTTEIPCRLDQGV